MNTTTTISEFFSKISDDRLKGCIKELHEFRSTGILCNGLMRTYALQLANLIGMTCVDAISICTTEFLHRAAYAYASQAPETPTIPTLLYRHVKTGNLYRSCGVVKDCTNGSEDGFVKCLYYPEGQESVRFVREYVEFHEKFKVVE